MDYVYINIDTLKLYPNRISEVSNTTTNIISCGLVDKGINARRCNAEGKV